MLIHLMYLARGAGRLSGRRRYDGCLRAGWVMVFACALTTLAWAQALQPSDPLRYRGGLRLSAGRYKLSGKQVTALEASLRQKTGYRDLRFDEAGFLTLGDAESVAGGSPAARELIRAVVNSHNCFELESHDRSPQIVFASLGTSTIYESRASGARIEVRPVQLDFYDFRCLQGSKEVLAAFDPGFALLHELVHGVLHLHDALDDSSGVGECEDYINRIRRELGLPERQTYIARSRQVIYFPAVYTRLAELVFARAAGPEERGKVENQYLSWELQRVGATPRPLLSNASEKVPPPIVALKE